MTLVRDLVRSRELLANLVGREIKGKYKRTALGQLWSLANPLAQMVVFTVVFSQFIRIDVPEGDPSRLKSFALFLMCGLLPWSFFANSLTGGMSSLVANENLIKKVWFPRAALPVASTGALLFSWGMEMVVLLVALLAFGAFAHVVGGWLSVVGLIAFVVVFMAVLAIFSAGAALVFSVVNVYFRDVQHLTTIVLQAWFYLTPIIYPITLVEDKEWTASRVVGDVTVLDLYRTNPMERFVAVFRSLLYDNRLPATDDVLWVVAWTMVVAAVGIWLFGRHEKRLAEVL